MTNIIYLFIYLILILLVHKTMQYIFNAGFLLVMKIWKVIGGYVPGLFLSRVSLVASQLVPPQKKGLAHNPVAHLFVVFTLRFLYRLNKWDIVLVSFGRAFHYHWTQHPCFEFYGKRSWLAAVCSLIFKWTDIVLRPLYHYISFVSSSVSYHEATGDIWLKDFVKGALGEGTAVEGENLWHVAQTVFIVSAALHCQRSLGVVGAGFVACCTWRVECSVEL